MDTQRSILFHLDEDIIPADDMKKCVTAFYDLVKSASEDLLMGEIKWYAEIKKGSVAMAAYPECGSEEADEAISSIRSSLKVIEGGRLPSGFSRATAGKYKNLVDIFADGRRKPPTITATSPTMPSEPPVRLVSLAAKDEEPCITAFGTAHGRVKSLSATGTPYIALYDDAVGKRVKVLYDTRLLDVVRKSYMNDVTVVGEITYNADGTKKTINASEIFLDDAKEKKERLSDLFGILGDAK